MNGVNSQQRAFVAFCTALTFAKASVGYLLIQLDELMDERFGDKVIFQDPRDILSLTGTQAEHVIALLPELDFETNLQTLILKNARRRSASSAVLITTL